MICPTCQTQNDEGAEACFQCGAGLRSITRGSVVAGRYEIQQVLGRGGMGVVYRAWDRALEEAVALKVLRGPAGGGEAGRRFRHEIKLARQVRHRNVCGIHEYGEDGPLQYIAMEFVDGVDLRKALQERGPLPPREAFDVAIQMAAGLQAIHDEGIVHRDLKTANLMRDRSGRVRLMDFGIAKRFEGDALTQVTGTGMAVGTPEYMSPEQVRSEPIDARSDIYAMGIVIYELFTARRPFEGDTPLATLFQHLQAPPPLEGPEAERLPGPLVPVLRRALAKERDERFASAAELQQALRAARAQALPGVEAATGESDAAEGWGDDRGTTGAGVHPTGTMDMAAATAPGLPPTRPAARGAGTATQPAATRVPAPLAPGPATQVPRTATQVPPAPRARRPHPLAMGAIAAGVLVAAAGVVVLGRRTPPPGPAPAGSLLPPPEGTGIGAASPAGPGPEPSGPISTALPSPATTPAIATSTPPVRPSAGPAVDLGRLDRLAETDPEAALAAALKASGEAPSPALRERVNRYRAAAVGRLVASGRAALKRASVAGSAETYEEALGSFEKAVAVNPLDEEAQRGRTEALRALELLKSRSAAVGFVLSETAFTPPPSAAAPPGLGRLPEGVVAKPANPPAPRARLVIEMIPSQLRPQDEYVLRYSVFNRSGAPLTMGSVSIRNRVGGSATGGVVEPRARSASPQTRTLLVETGGTWSHDRTTEWASTLTVVMDDGSVYAATLSARP